MNRQEVQEEAIKATEGRQRSSVALGTGEIINLKNKRI
jgi:hypothetical protein